MNFYSAWFCPYAQRAWLTLEHHKIPFEYVESLTVKDDQKEGDHGYQKTPRLLELNPKGLVPTLEFPPQYNFPKSVQLEKLKQVGNSLVLSESIDCIEFLNDMARSATTGGEQKSPKQQEETTTMIFHLISYLILLLLRLLMNSIKVFALLSTKS
jgi:Glutathione S-transferase